MHPDTFRACNCKLKCTWVQHRSVPTTPLKLSLNRFYRFHTMALRMPNTPDTLVQRCLLALPRLMLQRQKNKINFIPTFSLLESLTNIQLPRVIRQAGNNILRHCTEVADHGQYQYGYAEHLI